MTIIFDINASQTEIPAQTLRTRHHVLIVRKATVQIEHFIQVDLNGETEGIRFKG